MPSLQASHKHDDYRIFVSLRNLCLGRTKTFWRLFFPTRQKCITQITSWEKLSKTNGAGSCLLGDTLSADTKIYSRTIYKSCAKSYINRLRRFWGLFPQLVKSELLKLRVGKNSPISGGVVVRLPQPVHDTTQTLSPAATKKIEHTRTQPVLVPLW